VTRSGFISRKSNKNNLDNPAGLGHAGVQRGFFRERLANMDLGPSKKDSDAVKYNKRCVPVKGDYMGKARGETRKIHKDTRSNGET